MALIGKPFHDYVKNQVTQRQDSLGEGFGGTNTSRKLKTLNVYNSSTPWMRLASAVSITKPTEDSPGISVYQQILNSGLFDGFGENVWGGRELARNFVLQGAPNTAKAGVNIATAATDTTAAIPNDAGKAYGFGYGSSQINSEQGYVPPPGVTSIDFEYKNDGALAFATVSIKAFSATQFSMIDILYMRPGYTCLLEFGHSMYYNNKGELINFSPSFTSPFGYLFNPDTSSSYTKMAEKIQKEKKKHDGNYEGFFARIMKFNWKFNMDGSYDITVKLAGLGSVITSLKTNIPKMTTTPSTFNSDFEPKPFADVEERKKFKAAAEEVKAFVISDAMESQLNFELYAFFADKVKYQDSKASVFEYFGVPDTNYPSVGYDVEMVDIPIENKKKSYIISHGVVKFDVADMGGTKYSPTTLIKFGVFLSMLQKICNITDGEGKNSLIQFEMVNDISQGIEKQKELDDTFIVTYPGNFSSNPNKCLIKYDDYDYSLSPNLRLPIDTTINLELSRLDNSGANNAIQKLPNPSRAMRLSDVYININFISEVLRNLRGADPEAENYVDVSIMDLLKGILSGVNTCLGGLNNFRVVFSEETSQIQFLSEVPGVTQEIDSPSKSLSILNTYGFDTTTPKLEGGSFVTSVDINSELTDQMATQISIGAQNNSNTINGNSTSFSIYNKGLIDTLMEVKKSPLEDETSPIPPPFVPSPEVQAALDDLAASAPASLNFDGTEASMNIVDPADLVFPTPTPTPSTTTTPTTTPTTTTTPSPSPTSPSLSQEYIDKINTIFTESEFLFTFNEVYNFREFDETSYISGLEKVSLSISSLMTGESTNNSQSPAPFFLPFNMSLEMRGLGGIRIFDAFSINGKGLPLSYDPKSIKLIVKSLSHTVSLDGWKTKIATLPQPIFNIDSTPPPPPPTSSPTFTSGEGGYPTDEDWSARDTSKDVPGADGSFDALIYILTNPNDGFIAIEEGFLPNAEYDVNAYRLGHGTDTLTAADGSITKVTATSTVTRVGATRDLVRRVRDGFYPKVLGRLNSRGVDFSLLEPSVQVVFIDIAYNYGTLFYDYINAYISGGKQGLINELNRRAAIPGQTASRRRKEIKYLQKYN
tara:strand:- start:543 stop:3851 length:3309 start_codon:yes stop_codon:yes gene_type:complete